MPWTEILSKGGMLLCASDTTTAAEGYARAYLRIPGLLSPCTQG